MRLAFAYGSGVFHQHGHVAMSNNMLDFIFVVDNCKKWHQHNMLNNGHHYSFLKHFGHNYVSNIQNKFGAHTYFNTLVPCEGRLIKYGVIETQDFLTDMLEWRTLYIAGRLHKPVNIIHKDPSIILSKALLTNLQSAIHASLLLLPEKFDENQLYETITGLSYLGDFRMKIGEDLNKIRNIVKPNLNHFRELYEPILHDENYVHKQHQSNYYKQDIEHSARKHHLNLLPSHLSAQLLTSNCSTEHNYMNSLECASAIHTGITEIVKKSSWSQSIKGLLTAGMMKSVLYSKNKIKKMMNSRMKIRQ